jgi:hypothetical protein
MILQCKLTQFIYNILWFLIDLILRRQCYFAGERHLKFFKLYTKANCELECMTNLTLRYCNCSAFYMPRKWFSEFTTNNTHSFNPSGSEGTPICKYDQHLNCPGYAQTMISKFSQLKFICDSNSIDREIDCSCLSSCDEIFYEIHYIDKNDYQRDEIELSKTNLNG